MMSLTAFPRGRYVLHIGVAVDRGCGGASASYQRVYLVGHIWVEGLLSWSCDMLLTAQQTGITPPRALAGVRLFELHLVEARRAQLE